MVWQRKRPAKCSECGKPNVPDGEVSYRGLCIECGIGRACDAISDMANKRGPHYEAWREGMRRAADPAT